MSACSVPHDRACDVARDLIIKSSVSFPVSPRGPSLR